MKSLLLQLTFIRYGTIVLAFFALSPMVSFAVSIVPSEVVGLANSDRLAIGLAPLRFDETLARAAEAKADDMVEKKYFAHTSPEGKTPWFFFEKAEYPYRFAGENLAIHFTDAKDEESAWMASEKHRENILSPKYVDTGVAVREMQWEGKATLVVVQLFGTRQEEVSSGGAVLGTTPVPSGKSIFGSHTEQIATPSIRTSLFDKDVKDVNLVPLKTESDTSSWNFLEITSFVFLCGFIILETVSFGIVFSIFYRKRTIIRATPM